jgi:hypothetical protein
MAAPTNHPQLSEAGGVATVDTAMSLVSTNALENKVISQALVDYGLVSTSITGATFPVVPVLRQFFLLNSHATLTNGLFQEDGVGGWQRITETA